MTLLRWNRKYARGIGGKRLFEGNGQDTRWIVSDVEWNWLECQDGRNPAGAVIVYINLCGRVPKMAGAVTDVRWE
jgi:hypothetical protein